ncbi:hypothetical protein D9619_011894 [Psilocybe cf. subviscida]|uniref:NACHT domain-containing protein n=1 Tax=Psilocybe cf. subviscida TaxID=2480587 RepID=A0A8H5B0C3_9AGAR|nr:hypothetical protein D9619_011894 [Psilocybe cf. subviscida]
MSSLSPKTDVNGLAEDRDEAGIDDDVKNASGTSVIREEAYKAVKGAKHTARLYSVVVSAMPVVVCSRPASSPFSIPSPSLVPMSNTFRNTNNIQDSSLTVIVDSSGPGSLDRLFDEVAPNAILNAGGRAHEARCYPGTREEVIGKIERFIDGQDESNRRMMWLSGPPGAGKSAIAQTVAECCQERGIHAANFFFFRSDGTRNFAQPLVATLVYQLLGLYPALNGLLTDCLTTRPLICRASIREQFRHLLSSPIQHLSRIRRPDILIVDGLDECDDKQQQQQILQALYSLVKKPNSLFRVLVTSRDEHQIRIVMTFDKIRSSLERISLDDDYRPHDDIRRFVTAKFDEIKTAHPLAHTLVKGWPANEDVDTITNESSGQFIYAATVMHFIEYSPANPAVSLLAIHGLQPSGANSPFAQLDAIYSYIFSQAPDIRAVKLCLGAHFLIQKRKLLGAGELFAAVAAGPPIQLVFHHASLHDYLKDQPRSGIYYIDEQEIALELSLLGLSNLQACNPDLLIPIIWTLSHVKEETPDLSEHLLDASALQFGKNTNWTESLWHRLVSTIERLYFETDKPLFELMLQHWIHFAYNNKLNIDRYDDPLGTGPASKYYNQYLATERVKFQRRLKK